MRKRKDDRDAFDLVRPDACLRRGVADMMMFQFLGPLIASVLYLVVFQKAGFQGAVLGVAALPVVGALLGWALLGTLAMVGGSWPLIYLLSLALSLAPLFVLAFKAWPPVTAPAAQSEK